MTRRSRRRSLFFPSANTILLDEILVVRALHFKGAVLRIAVCADAAISRCFDLIHIVLILQNAALIFLCRIHRHFAHLHRAAFTAGAVFDMIVKEVDHLTLRAFCLSGEKRFLDESDCHVAISMHSPLHEQRLRLMPAEKAMPLEETIALLKQYDFTHQRRCSFEYICFGGLNDSPLYAREIVKLLQGLECRVNLIRFHEIPDVDLPSSDEQRMEALRDYLTAHGVTTTIRASRGQDIFAACGLLSTAKQSQLDP